MSTPEPARISFSYRFTRRDGLRQFAAVSPLAGVAVLLLLVVSVLTWDLPGSIYPRLVAGLVVVLAAISRGYQWRALGGYGLGEHTVTLDGDAVTCAGPTKSTSQPWDAWSSPRRRLGVLAVPLTATPGSAVLVPLWRLSPEDRAALTAFLDAFLPGQAPDSKLRAQPGDDPV